MFMRSYVKVTDKANDHEHSQTDEQLQVVDVAEVVQMMAEVDWSAEQMVQNLVEQNQQNYQANTETCYRHCFHPATHKNVLQCTMWLSNVTTTHIHITVCHTLLDNK